MQNVKMFWESIEHLYARQQNPTSMNNGRSLYIELTSMASKNRERRCKRT